MRYWLLPTVVLVCVISSIVEAQQVWKNSYTIMGFKEYNNITDVDKGNSILSLFVDTAAQYQRIDITNSLTGHIASTTVSFNEVLFQLFFFGSFADFLKKLYYLNYPTDKFCYFEHLRPDQRKGIASARPLPYKDGWTQNNMNVTFVGKTNQCGFSNAFSCNIYRLEKGSQQATGFAFSLFNYFGNQFNTINYMEDINTKKPVQFQGDIEGIRTNFYVIDFTSIDSSFPAETFTQNIHSYCH